MKLKKKIPLIDQHNKYGFWGDKFGGSFIPETLKKPIDDLTKEFNKLRRNKKFIKTRDFYFKNYIGSPTSFIKLDKYSEDIFFVTNTSKDCEILIEHLKESFSLSTFYLIPKISNVWTLTLGPGIIHFPTFSL